MNFSSNAKFKIYYSNIGEANDSRPKPGYPLEHYFGGIVGYASQFANEYSNHKNCFYNVYSLAEISLSEGFYDIYYPNINDVNMFTCGSEGHSSLGGLGGIAGRMNDTLINAYFGGSISADSPATVFDVYKFDKNISPKDSFIDSAKKLGTITLEDLNSTYLGQQMYLAQTDADYSFAFSNITISGGKASVVFDPQIGLVSGADKYIVAGSPWSENYHLITGSSEESSFEDGVDGDVTYSDLFTVNQCTGLVDVCAFTNSNTPALTGNHRLNGVASENIVNLLNSLNQGVADIERYACSSGAPAAGASANGCAIRTGHSAKMWQVTQGKNKELPHLVGVTIEDSHPGETSSIALHRMHNPISGEHFYTSDLYEISQLTSLNGWIDEDVCWTTSEAGTPVQRLHNPISGEHHYTSDTYEISVLTSQYGWIDEGIGWYSEGTTPIYRLHNPISGEHLHTKDLYEISQLTSLNGWIDEGIKSYSLD
jgi:hypothetical protein